METTKQSLGPLQLKWVEALESGSYLQGKLRLCRANADGTLAYCCLGVACEVVNVTKEKANGGFHFPDGVFRYDDSTAALPKIVLQKMKFHDIWGTLKDTRLDGYTDLTEANDQMVPFTVTAAFIRANPEAVFSEEA